MKNNITYFHKNNDVEYISYHNVTQRYPTHTHVSHVTSGFILEGAVCITCDGRKRIYHAGEYFRILPDTPHAVEPADGSPYSMLCICINTEAITAEPEAGAVSIGKLKRLLMEAPETPLLIEDMARYIKVSPYHMIRRFRTECGLTPHQFQMQCRVRKAQRMLEAGKSVIDVAYDAGFCDQSHFDRCFHRIVRLTPREYVQSVRRFA